MNNALIFKTGVILYALVIGFFGVNHFLHASGMAGMVPGYMPGGGKLWIYITGTGMILAAIAFLTRKYVRIAGLLLAAMLIIFVLTIHLPGLNDGNQMAMTNALKDTALAAAALIIAAKW
jgi:putative oxidoreductase